MYAIRSYYEIENKVCIFAAAFSRVRRSKKFVITSYSIHYTKLYETWKYPSCILKGDNSVGEFYSIAVTNNFQQADTGTKMVHLGKNTKSTIISKGISAGKAQNSYRGLVQRNNFV